MRRLPCANRRAWPPPLSSGSVALSFLLVDSLGRRPLLLAGSFGCAAALACLVPADALDAHGPLVAGMAAFILFFSLSWAG